MRPGQHNKRGRGRNRRHSGGGGSSSSGGGNPINRIYESNGPDVKVRGTAQTVAEKYLQLGRDAHVSGDPVMSESYFQHAEHYLRIIAAAQAYNQQMQQQYRRPNEDMDGDDDGEEGNDGEGDDTQPMAGERPYQQDQSDLDQPDAGFDPDRSQPPPHPQQFRPREQNRDRYRSRWDRNRDQQRQDQPRDTRDQESQPQAAQPQPRQETQPRPEPALQPAEAPEGNGAGGAWEAPSFLRRGSANGGNGEPHRRVERKSRRERSEESEAASAETPAAETPSTSK